MEDSGSIPDGYKRTEAGVLPNGWQVRLLGQVVEFLDGQRRPIRSSDRAKISGVYPYYGASGIVDYVNDFLFDEDLILLGEDGENILSRNTRLAFKVSGKIWVNNHAHVLRPLDGMAIDYLVEYLESLDYEQYNSGTAQPKLNRQACFRIPTAVPPLPEQRAIAAALSDADGLIGALDALIEKKRAIKQAAMQQLLTGKKRLPGFTGEWETKRLGDHTTLIRNGTTYAASLRDGVPITRIETISSGFVDLSRVGYAKYSKVIENYKLQSGDILYSHINSIDHIGKVAQVSDVQELYHGMNLLVIRPGDNTNSKWLFYVLNAEFARNWARSIAKQAVSQASINTKEIKTFPISTPPLPEQRAIAAVLSDMDAEIAALERRREKVKQIKQGMMQQLLTGRIRLVEPPEAAA